MAEVNGALAQLLAPVMEIERLNIPPAIIHDTIFRLLFNEGVGNIARLSDVLGLHPKVLDEVMSQMKLEHLVEVTKAGQIGSLSFTYSLTDKGRNRAQDAFDRSLYIGRLPVSLNEYTQAILMQTSGGDGRRATPETIKQALSHLILPENFHRRIGPAVNAGSSLFLYGPPGNGKTTVAEAIGKVLSQGSPIWLPDAITVGGQIIQVFDPLVHEPLPQDEIAFHTQFLGKKRQSDRMKIDNRWRLFKRPLVMVGGELTLDSLDLRYEPIAKVYEAPLQFKANGGMFLIDDFGRQQVSPQQLLNRWIVPLESRKDFLRLQSGQSLEVPFRQFIVFSTNLDPMQLVDDAFLRRIQMKVEVRGPDERLYYKIFTRMCDAYMIPFDKKSFVHLLQKWYREPKRTMQAVHPRDILKTAVAICEYEDAPLRLSPTLLDEACLSYFVDADKTTDPTQTAARGV